MTKSPTPLSDDAVALREAIQRLHLLASDLERFDPWRGTRSKSDARDLRAILQALTPMDPETVARTFYTARRAATGFDLHGVTEVDWDDLPEDMKADYRAGAKAVLARQAIEGEGTP